LKEENIYKLSSNKLIFLGFSLRTNVWRCYMFASKKQSI